ncbi:large ribosomal subunit protein mL42 isoform X2 [Ictidomys tridecemlineatus]
MTSPSGCSQRRETAAGSQPALCARATFPRRLPLPECSAGREGAGAGSHNTRIEATWRSPDSALSGVCHKSTFSSLPDDYNCKVELALTSDGRTIVCYHPSVDIPYEHTQPIPQPDPLHNNEETHDQVLKTRLEEKDEHLEEGPMIEKLSKMFFTTKHRWYPHGQYILLFKVS